MGVPPYPGQGKPSKSESESVHATFFQFLDILIRHFEKYLHTMKLKLTKDVGITIFLLYKQKPSEILIFRTIVAKF